MIVNDSARLGYQLLTKNDADCLFQLDQDTEVMRYINGGDMTSLHDIETIKMPRLLSYTNPAQGWGMWKVTLIENNRYLGWILVRPHSFFSDNPDFGTLELGWRFFRSCWGHGYASEAATATLNALHSQMGITKFMAIADANNYASIKVMKTLGMSYVETVMHQDPLGDSEVVYYNLNFDERSI